MNCQLPPRVPLPCLRQVFGRRLATLLIGVLLSTFATQSALFPRLVLQRLLTPAQMRETEGHSEEPTPESKSVELAFAAAARHRGSVPFRRAELLPTTKDQYRIAWSCRAICRPADQAAVNGYGGPLRC
jgi:hypothetical protein